MFSPPPGEFTMKLRLLLKVFLVAAVIPDALSTDGNEYGSCYRIRFNDNECGHLLQVSVSRDRCCKGHYRRAWNPASADSEDPPVIRGLLLNNNISVEGSTSEERNLIVGKRSTSCIPCYTSCQDIKCDEDQKCVIRHGLPKCVCSPMCHLQHKSAVCGTDGRTYVSECHLLKRSCRKKQRLLVAHSGPCQTCSGVKCKSRKKCVLDEILTPRCSKCPNTCYSEEKKKKRRRPICGEDGVTYPSKCFLKMASCKAGITIKRAYKGPCRKDASCSSVKCWRDETCLTDTITGQPLCTYCGDRQHCPPTPRFICASDGSTFQSWCAFKHASCRYKKALTVVPFHYCSSNATKANGKVKIQNDCSDEGGGYSKRKNLKLEAKKVKTRLESRKSKLKGKRNMKKSEISESGLPGAAPSGNLEERSTGGKITGKFKKERRKTRRKKRRRSRKNC